MFASVLHLNRADVKALKITDPYSLHRVVYSLYEDIRSTKEKKASQPSGLLYADQGGDVNGRRILLLANREPMARVDGKYGEVQSKAIPDDFLEYDRYTFKVVINPTRRDGSSRKIMPIKGREAIAAWFANRAVKNWGFDVISESLQVNQVNVKNFIAQGAHKVTLAQANLQGVLKVNDIEKFTNSFHQGIGRSRAFGCGLLQIVPYIDHPFS